MNEGFIEGGQGVGLGEGGLGQGFWILRLAEGNPCPQASLS